MDSIVPVVHLKSVLIREVAFGGIGLIRGVASLEDSIVPVVHQKSVLIRGVTFGEIGLIRGVTSLRFLMH
jgi:hypothetical protein